MYFSFDCDTSTGQVSFNASNGTYRVVIIDPSTQKFVIQDQLAGNGKNSTGIPPLNKSLPFNATKGLSLILATIVLKLNTVAD
ncbi:hypothetical protein SLA2020_435270 [Shorea laevis]